MMESNAILSRREVLGSAAVGAGLALLPHRWMTAAAAEQRAKPGGFRFVHFADAHIQPESRAEEGVRKALAVIHELKPRPDFILTGGDNVMDVLETPEPRCKMLFKLLMSVCKDSDIPFRFCIGNHDIFGWGPRNKQSPDHPLYGTKMARDALGLAETSYSFDHKGWHFTVVDDILLKGEPAGGYEGGLTAERLDWLDKDLAAAGDRPKIVCTHIPVVAVSIFRGVDASNQPETIVPRGMVCRNPGPILALLRKHNVTLVLAGHTHELETAQYEKTTHIVQGAVSGHWWGGPQHLSPEGFGVIDVHADGTIHHLYQTYGWKAGKG